MDCDICEHLVASQVELVVKNPPVNAGDARDAGLIPGSGRSAGEGNGNPLQYSCLANSMDRLQSTGSQRARHDWATGPQAAQITFRRSIPIQLSLNAFCSHWLRGIGAL